MKLFNLLIMIFFSLNIYAKDQKFQMPNIKSGSKVELGRLVESAMKEVVGDFELLKLEHFSKTSLEYGLNHPMATVADFNGDGYRDIVVLGYSKSKKTAYVYGFISNYNRKKYDSYEIDSFPEDETVFKNNSMYLTLAPKDKIKNLTRDLVQVETYGPGATSVQSYYFSKKQGNFELFKGKLD